MINCYFTNSESKTDLKQVASTVSATIERGECDGRQHTPNIWYWPSLKIVAPHKPECVARYAPYNFQVGAFITEIPPLKWKSLKV